jgi:hypothetical protein
MQREEAQTSCDDKGHRRVTEMTLNAFNALVELALAIELETDVVCGAP